ncbi:MAG: carbohydrate kinase [Alphaproteobacteria bacterium]|nr:carbohydrate kinase [Alphaproteobacteria bacterium]
MAVPSTIIVGGENLIDFVETHDINGIPQYSANPGGSPFNVAIAAARLGNPVDYLSPLSTDRLGKLLAERLLGSGVAVKAPRLDAPTSLAVVSLEEGQPTYQFYRKDTAERLITRQGLQDALKSDPWAFHIGSLAISGGEDAVMWHEFFTQCYQRGYQRGFQGGQEQGYQHDSGEAAVITSLDPNVRPALIENRAGYMARLEDMFTRADIIKLSDEDIAWLYPEMEIMAAFDHLCAISCKGLRVLTRGGDGAIASSPVARVETPARPVHNLVDTVGAGDTFMAAMLAWLPAHGKTSRADLHALSERDLGAMTAWAAQAAAMNCQQQGCNPPHLAEMTPSSGGA